MSELTFVEFTSALARLHRMELLDDPWAISEQLERHAVDVYTSIEPLSVDYGLARALLLADSRLGLRGADALDLAIATRLGDTLYTLDRVLLNAAKSLGIPATDANTIS